MISNKNDFLNRFQISAIGDTKKEGLPNFNSEIDISISQRSLVDYLLLLIAVIAVLGFFFVVGLR